MWHSLKSFSTRQKDRLIGSFRSKIRERAIENAKVQIALQNRTIDEYAPEQLEIIVRDEEEKIVRKLKGSALVVVLIYLGLS